MNRRELLAAGGALIVASIARAQKSARLPGVGFLHHGVAPALEQVAQNPYGEWWTEHGWTEGKTLHFENAYAGGKDERLAELAAELVQKHVDVIWANGPVAAIAAARATKTIPIVFWGVNYPVERGLVESLSRPGRNVTGMAFSPGFELRTKQLELLKQIAPQVSRVAWVHSITAIRTVAGDEVPEATAVVEAGARKLGIELRFHRVERSGDLDGLFAAVLASGAQAIGLVGDPLTYRERRRIVDFANLNRLASTFGQRDFADVGGLVSYGPDTLETVLQSFTYVDRILHGARPTDLPVEQPSKYYLTINVKTARELNLTIPQVVLLRADRVIE